MFFSKTFTLNLDKAKVCRLVEGLRTLSCYQCFKGLYKKYFSPLTTVTPPRRLIFIYLANDVIQNSKKKGPEFTKDFGTVLADAFKVGYK